MIEVTITEKLADNLYRAVGGPHKLLVKRTGWQQCSLALSDRYASMVGKKTIVHFQNSRPVHAAELKVGTFLTFPNIWIYTTNYD